MATIRVNAEGLNLRSSPQVKPGNKIAVLQRGQLVELLEGAPNAEWWRIRLRMGNTDVDGWVARRFLVIDGPEMQPASAIRAVHLREGRADVTRNSRGSAYAYPLGEPTQPRRNGGSRDDRVRAIANIIDWLSVDTSIRYKREGNTTYCNIYATDYSYLNNAYLPRVWWTGGAIAKLASGESVTPAYGTTVQEMTANQLYQWLSDFGDDFGWRRTFDMNEVQDAANEGLVGILCAQRTQLNKPGHITAVVPENDAYKARRASGRVTVPLQSQAGLSNWRYRASLWWADPKFRAFGFWIHD